MVKLTEDMIVARTRVSDMGHVKKLNCWGAELTDVSVLRKLSNVEVLSLSVNCISTLEDIHHCKSLQELYIRKNKIPDISEICWLRDLPRLKNLWLEENPCSEGGNELYRLTVIKTLPQLQKLDNVPVSSDEMSEAMRRGLEVIHPLDGGGVAGGGAGGGGGGQEYEERRESRCSGYEQEYEQQRRESIQSPSRRVSNQVFEENRMSYSQRDRAPDEEVRRMSIREESPRYSEEYRPQRASYSGPSSDPYYNSARGPYATTPEPSRGSFSSMAEYRTSQMVQSDAHSIVNHHYNNTYRQVDQQLECAQQLLAQRGSSSPVQRPYPLRPKNRNSNVLSAILCLIKEIDGPSLEVVEMAVRCRMEELED